MTSEIIHFGPIGQGTAMKLVNNMLVQVGWIAIAEALVLGAKAGLDPKQMVETIGKATGNSVAFQYAAPRILARDFDGIRMDISYKDMELRPRLPSRSRFRCSSQASPSRSTRWDARRAWAAKTAAAPS